MDKKIAFKAHHIHKSFKQPMPVPILQGIDLEVFTGETVAITGRSGEGKSTLLYIIGTLEQPDAGTLSIAGKDVTAFNKSSIRSRHIGFIFQSFHLLQDFTALDNVLMPARIARFDTSPKTEIYQKACSLLERVGLADRMHFFTKLLSGGEKQRVSIARALCNDPDIILADEPTGNLDRANAEGIHEILLQFAQEHNKTLIVVTHNKDLASLCSRSYTLREGKLS